VSTTSTEAGFTLLDLLINEDPNSGSEARRSESERERAVRQGAEMDISNLLNTRHWLGTWPSELELLRYSILNYGLPDVSGAAIDSKPVQNVLSQTVRKALEVFEPRLSGIKVVLTTGIAERGAQLLITADLRGTTEPLGLRRGLQRTTSAAAKDAPA
jgi:type VI secretion system lysozyme-like protein